MPIQKLKCMYHVATYCCICLTSPILQIRLRVFALTLDVHILKKGDSWFWIFMFPTQWTIKVNKVKAVLHLYIFQFYCILFVYIICIFEFYFIFAFPLSGVIWDSLILGNFIDNASSHSLVSCPFLVGYIKHPVLPRGEGSLYPLPLISFDLTLSKQAYILIFLLCLQPC